MRHDDQSTRPRVIAITCAAVILAGMVVQLNNSLMAGVTWIICLLIYTLAQRPPDAWRMEIQFVNPLALALLCWLTLGIIPAILLIVIGGIINWGRTPLTYTTAILGGLLAAGLIQAVLAGRWLVGGAMFDVLPASLGIAGALGWVLLLTRQRLRLRFTTLRDLLDSSSELIILVSILPLALIYRQHSEILFIISFVLLGLYILNYRHVIATQFDLSNRLRELSILNDVHEALAGQIVLNDLLVAIGRWLQIQFEIDSFIVAFWDDQYRVWRYPLAYSAGKPLHDLLSGGRAAHLDTLLHQQQPAIFHWGDAGIGQPLFAMFPTAASGCAVMALPLQVGNKSLGVLLILIQDSSNILMAVRRSTLATLATQLSLMLRNAVLYDRSQNLADNLKRLNQTVERIIFDFDSQRSVRVACELAAEIVRARKAAVFIAPADQPERSVLLASYGLTEAHRRLYQTDPQMTPNVMSIALRVILDVALHADDAALQALAAAGQFRGMVIIPLKSGTLSVGALLVFHDEPRTYHPSEIELLESLAYQVTAALDNAELLRALEQYAYEQSQLLQLARQGTSSLYWDDAVSELTGALQNILKMDGALIGLWDSGANQLTCYPERGLDPAVIHLDAVGELAEVFQSGIFTPAAFMRREGTYSSGLNFLFESWEMSMLIAEPLLMQKQPFGVLLLLAKEERPPFTGSEWRLLELAVSQIAVQLHNALVYSETQRALAERMQELTLIEQIARDISRAVNLDHLMRRVMEAALLATRADVAILGLVDATQRQVLILERVGAELRYVAEPSMTIDGLMAQALLSGQVRVVVDNALAEGYSTRHLHGVYRSSVIIPLRRDEQTIGVLNLESQQRGFFNAYHVAFLESVAGHAVISIENAQLLAARQRQIDTLTHLQELAILLSNDTDYHTAVWAILRAAMQIKAARYAVMFEYDQEGGALYPLLALDENGEELDSLPGRIPEMELREALYERQPRMVDVVFTADASPYHVVILPMIRGRSVREILCLVFDRIPTELDQLELMTIQAAGHLENTRLYQSVKLASERMRAILDAAVDGIILLDDSGRVIDANATTERLLQIPLMKYIGSNFDQVWRTFYPERESQLRAVLNFDPSAVVIRSVELMVDNEIRYIDQISNPVTAQNGDLTGSLMTLRDVTEQRLLAAYRDEISSMVVHDLRSPLSSVITSLYFLMEIGAELPAEDLREILATSLHSAELLLDLINSLLDIARLETQRMPLRPLPVSVASLVEGATNALRSNLTSANIELRIEVDDDLPLVSVDGDKIRRVLINLLDNAIRFTPDGQPALVRAEQTGDKITVWVADSGPGIPPDEVTKVFEKFRQVEGATPLRGSHKGSGLGLTFCKLTVEAHGEAIWVEQEQRLLAGACFAFTLPIAPLMPGNLSAQPELIGAVK